MAQTAHIYPALAPIESPPFWPQPPISCQCGATLHRPAIYYDSNEVAVEILYRCNYCKGITIKDTGANYVERFMPFE